MIAYRQTKWRELKGEYKAVVTDIAVEENKFFDPMMDNSTKSTLTITFNLQDPTTLEAIEYVQKFVSPLTGGNGLFQQLLNAKDIIPDIDGGELDEQDLVGLELIVTMGKREAKNGKSYPNIEKVAVSGGPVKPAPQKKTTKEDDVPSDLPFD